MRVGRVEMLVANRVVEAVERSCIRPGVFVDIKRSTVRNKPESAGILARRRRCVEFVAFRAPVVHGDRVRSRVAEDVAADAITDRVGSVGCVRRGCVVV